MTVYIHKTVQASRRLPSPAITIIVTSIGRGRFDARLEGGALLVGSSRQPFCDACRVLLDHGVAPDRVAVMRHAGSAVDALRAPVGVAAALTVEESDHRPIRLRPWKGPPAWDGSPPIAQIGEAAE